MVSTRGKRWEENARRGRERRGRERREREEAEREEGEREEGEREGRGRVTYQSGMVLARPGCSPSRTQTCGMPQGTSLHLHPSDKCVDSGWETSNQNLQYCNPGYHPRTGASFLCFLGMGRGLTGNW